MKILLVPGCLILVGFAPFSLQSARADNTTPPGTSMPASGSGNADGARAERIKGAFAQLNLTEAQKEQIEKIRASTTDRKERRHAIIDVLTPDQRAKFKELREEHKAAKQGSGAPSTASGT
jgi:Spy/CpxP family protein refolding chaperone